MATYVIYANIEREVCTIDIPGEYSHTGVICDIGRIVIRELQYGADKKKKAIFLMRGGNPIERHCFNSLMAVHSDKQVS